jgi:diguanylate cyclase (GGDEF)-like protein
MNMRADPVSAIRSRLSLTRVDSYGVLLLLLLVIGAWLVADFVRERDRIMAERSRLAINKSQLMNRSFGDTFLAADYVLRDVLGRARMGKDLAYPQPEAEVTARLEALLKEKVLTVAGLTDLVLFNGDCIFAATANYPTRGTKSRQRFCSDARVEPGQSLHIQYMPPVNSASARPVVLMSRTVGSPEGVLLGGAMVVVDLEYAQQWITALEVEQDDVLALVDSNGTLLARNPPLPEAIGLRTSPPPNEPSFEQVEGSATFTAVSPIDGRERIIGMSKLERFPFIVIVGFDTARVLSDWQHRAWQFAAGYIVLSALALMALRVQRATRRQREEMRELANTDTLTGIANRRHLVDIADREFGRARRYGHPLSVLMLDIDKFKTINDRWGHPTGDGVIQELARLTTSVIRGQDLCGRLGGDEFALILPETDASGAQLIAERLRSRAEASATVCAEDGTAVRFTISIGIASLSPEDSSFDALLQRADKELYQAKLGGRNRSVLAAGSTP